MPATRSRSAGTARATHRTRRTPLLTGGANTTLSTTGLVAKLTDAMNTLTTIEPFVFNLLCIPAMAKLTPSNQGSLVSAASTFCASQRAFLLVDPPEATITASAAQAPDPHRGSPRPRMQRCTTRG